MAAAVARIVEAVRTAAAEAVRVQVEVVCIRQQQERRSLPWTALHHRLLGLLRAGSRFEYSIQLSQLSVVYLYTVVSAACLARNTPA